MHALSVDEIPQLFNVLSGTMSFVGTAPPSLKRWPSSTPGCVGTTSSRASRGSGNRSADNPSFHACRRLDLFYVDNWSIGMDLSILLATVPMAAFPRAMSVLPAGSARRRSVCPEAARIALPALAHWSGPRRGLSRADGTGFKKDLPDRGVRGAGITDREPSA